MVRETPLECYLLPPWPQVSGDDGEGSVVGLKASEQVLGCSSTLRTLVSACRLSIGVILTHPVAMRRAEFCMT